MVSGNYRARRLPAAQLVRFGDNRRNVAVTEGDKVEAERRLGVSVNAYGVNDLVDVVDAVPDARVDELVADYADSDAVSPELRVAGDRHTSLREGAQAGGRYPNR